MTKKSDTTPNPFSLLSSGFADDRIINSAYTTVRIAAGPVNANLFENNLPNRPTQFDISADFVRRVVVVVHNKLEKKDQPVFSRTFVIPFENFTWITFTDDE